MSRDGSGVYHLPSGLYPQVANTTIESGDWNNLVADLEQDANTVRPIVAGGTGAATAALARTNLQAERSNQIVTNYDLQVFEAGSFSSTAGATNAPSANAVCGVAVVIDVNNIVLDANDMTTFKRYRRIKAAGVWGAWSDITATNYLPLAGGNLTGNLSLIYSDPTLTLQRAADTNVSQMYVNSGALSRWLWRFADLGATANFNLYPCNDAGVLQPAALSGDRGTGLFTVKGDPTAALGIVTKQYADAVNTNANTRVLRAGDTMTGALGIGGTLSVTGNAFFTANTWAPAYMGPGGIAAFVPANATTGYNTIYAPDTFQSLLIGGSADKANYYSNDAHYFRNRASTVMALLQATGFTFNTNLTLTSPSALIAPGGGGSFGGTITTSWNAAAGSPSTGAINAPNGGISGLTGWIGNPNPANAFVHGGRSGWGGHQHQMWDSTGGYYGRIMRHAVSGVAAAAFQLFSRDDDAQLGSITMNSTTSVAYNTTSDATLKENICPAREAMNTKAALMAIKVSQYTWKGSSEKQIGLLAQQVNETLPGVVQPPMDMRYTNEDGTEEIRQSPWMINLAGTTPYIIDVMQQQQDEIDALQAQLGVVMTQMAALMEKRT